MRKHTSAPPASRQPFPTAKNPQTGIRHPVFPRRFAPSFRYKTLSSLPYPHFFVALCTGLLPSCPLPFPHSFPSSFPAHPHPPCLFRPAAFRFCRLVRSGFPFPPDPFPFFRPPVARFFFRPSAPCFMFSARPPPFTPLPDYPHPFAVSCPVRFPSGLSTSVSSPPRPF